jgi:hypothetical protein
MAGKRSEFPSANALTQKVVELEVRLRDMMVIMAAISFTQEDKMFSVPVAVIEQIAGASVDFSFNRVTQEYEFRYVPPAPVEETVESPSGLILPASVHPEREKALRDPTKPLKGEVNL